MNMKKTAFFILLVLFATGIVFAQRGTPNPSAGVSYTMTTKPGVGWSQFHIAEVRNTYPYSVNVEIRYSVTRNGNTFPVRSVFATIGPRQTRNVQITSGIDLRVRVVEFIVKH